MSNYFSAHCPQVGGLVALTFIPQYTRRAGTTCTIRTSLLAYDIVVTLHHGVRKRGVEFTLCVAGKATAAVGKTRIV